MRRVLRGAVPLLAAALGFAPPASAQLADPADPADSTVVVSTDADDALPPPRVVPHRRIVLEPMKEASDGGADAAARPAVDLLAPPAVAPSGLPGATPAGRPVPRSSAARPLMTELHPLTVAAAPAAAAPAHVWPAAFLVSKDSKPAEAKQPAHAEMSDDLTPPPWENADAPVFADLRRRVETVHGRQVTSVAAETQADGVVVVRLRVRGSGADPNRGKVVELPQAPGSGVRVLLEFAR